jgi:two-component system LytT family sensor kinase
MRAPALKGRIRYPGPLALLLAWTLVGTLSYGRHYLVERPVGRAEHVLFEFLIWQSCFLPWVLLSPFVFRLERKFPLGEARPLRNVAVLASVGLALSYIGAQSSLALSLAIRFLGGAPLDIPTHWLKPPPDEISVLMLMYLASVGGGYFVRTLVRLQQREQEAAELALQKSQLENSLRQAELETLRARLNPHFLFNCLQNIAVLTQEDPKIARQMLVRVGDLLRTALRGDASLETTLQSELALTRSYVAIEQMRFGDRLSVLFDIAAETEAALVPTFLLQPLVENAIVHGLRDLQRGGIISIRSAVNSGSLILTVSDNGTGLDHEAEPGIGLSSTRERLARVYPGEHSFSIRSLPEGGTEVVIVIPRRFESLSSEVSHEQTALANR